MVKNEKRSSKHLFNTHGNEVSKTIMRTKHHNIQKHVLSVDLLLGRLLLFVPTHSCISRLYNHIGENLHRNKFAFQPRSPSTCEKRSTKQFETIRRESIWYRTPSHCRNARVKSARGKRQNSQNPGSLPTGQCSVFQENGTCCKVHQHCTTEAECQWRRLVHTGESSMCHHPKTKIR